MEIWKWVLVLIALTMFAEVRIEAEQPRQTERISGELVVCLSL